MKCCLEYIPVFEGLLEWGGKAFNFVYIFEEIPFEWHILSYKRRENVLYQRKHQGTQVLSSKN